MPRPATTTDTRTPARSPFAAPPAAALLVVALGTCLGLGLPFAAPAHAQSRIAGLEEAVEDAGDAVEEAAEEGFDRAVEEEQSLDDEFRMAPEEVAANLAEATPAVKAAVARETAEGAEAVYFENWDEEGMAYARFLEGEADYELIYNADDGAVIERGEAVDPEDLPDPVAATLRRERLKSNLEVVMHWTYEDGEQEFVAFLDDFGLERELVIAPDGALLSVVKELPSADLPPAVAAGFQRAAPDGAQMLAAYKIDYEGEVEYEIEYEADGDAMLIFLTEDGQAFDDEAFDEEP